ncbi:hypothetical protein LB504_007014 [Fusarium proliferatum]|nr:hypothetical protein LB504_007014 [Fusarium proliferatum]
MATRTREVDKEKNKFKMNDRNKQNKTKKHLHVPVFGLSFTIGSLYARQRQQLLQLYKQKLGCVCQRIPPKTTKTPIMRLPPHASSSNH